MPAAELPYQIAFYEKEPSGPQAVNYQFAAFAAICCNLLCLIANGLGAKIKTKFTPTDFIATKPKKTMASSAEELTTKMHIWATRAKADLRRRGVT
jgi:hypothetical protein